MNVVEFIVALCAVIFAPPFVVATIFVVSGKSHRATPRSTELRQAMFWAYWCLVVCALLLAILSAQESFVHKSAEAYLTITLLVDALIAAAILKSGSLPPTERSIVGTGRLPPVAHYACLGLLCAGGILLKNPAIAVAACFSLASLPSISRIRQTTAQSV